MSSASYYFARRSIELCLLKQNALPKILTLWSKGALAVFSFGVMYIDLSGLCFVLKIIWNQSKP